MVAVISVDAYPFLAFSDLTCDDDRRALTSDVTAYVNKNPYRVVQLPFKT